MNGYELSRKFVDFSFENPSKIKPNHYALYFFAIEHCNRLGWKKEYGLPTTMTMEAIGIKSYNTYIKTFNELVEYGFFKVVERSKNQYSANIIELSNYNKALDKALDKAFVKHSTKQSESTQQSIDSIDKQINKEQINNKQRTKDFDLFWSKYPNKVAKSNAKAKFLKLPQKDIDKIMQTIDSFVNYKPFEKYNHPNPTTYLNQKRWNDEIETETKKGIDNPNDEKIITFVTNVNPMKQQMTESNFIKYKANMEGGGYKFKIINNGD